MIKRYTVFYAESINETADGEYVLYEDIKHLLTPPAEVERLLEDLLSTHTGMVRELLCNGLPQKATCEKFDKDKAALLRALGGK
jgi:hypothetical protein